MVAMGDNSSSVPARPRSAHSIWNKYVRGRHQPPGERPPPSKPPVSFRMPASPEAVSPSSPMSTAIPKMMVSVHSQETTVSPDETPGQPEQLNQALRARPRGFSWGSSIRSASKARRNGSAISRGSLQNSEFGGGSPSSEFPPGTATTTYQDYDDSPENYYVYEDVSVHTATSRNTTNSFQSPTPAINDTGDLSPLQRSQTAPVDKVFDDENAKTVRRLFQRGVLRHSKLEKLPPRRAFTEELQLPSWDISDQVPAVDPSHSPAEQQRRLLQQLYGYMGDPEFDSSVTPIIQTAQTAVPVRLRRTSSVPSPLVEPLGGRHDQTKTVESGRLSNSSVSATKLSTQSLDEVVQNVTPSSVNMSPISDAAGQMSQPLMLRKQRRQRSLSVECIGRPGHSEYSPMNPYADESEFTEESLPATGDTEAETPSRRPSASLVVPKVRKAKLHKVDPTFHISSISLSADDFSSVADEGLLYRQRNDSECSAKQGEQQPETTPKRLQHPAREVAAHIHTPEKGPSTEENMHLHVQGLEGSPAFDDETIRLYWDTKLTLASPTPPTKTKANGEAKPMDTMENDKAWDAACLAYFKTKYRERLKSEHWRNEPFREVMGVGPTPQATHYLPTTNDQAEDDILPHILHDRLFYLALVLSASLKGHYTRQLWDLFGTHPGHLLTVYATLSSTNRPTGTGSLDLGDYLAAAVEGHQRTHSNSSTEYFSAHDGNGATLPSFESLANMITRKLDGQRVSPHEMILRQIKAQLRRLKQDFSAQSGLEIAWSARAMKDNVVRALPLYHGLQLYLASQQHLLTDMLKYSDSNLTDLSVLLGGALVGAFPHSENPAPTADVILVFDAPGSGKSRFLRDKVIETGGFYFLAPNLPPSAPPVPPKNIRSSSSPQSPKRFSTPSQELCMLQAGRNYASRDTYSLYQDLSFLEMSGIGAGRPVLGALQRPHDRLLDTKICIEPLLRARKFLLAVLPEPKAPIRWLQLQMTSSCSRSSEKEDRESLFDIFDVAYRLFRLAPRWAGEKASVHPALDQITHFDHLKLPVCVDEAQTVVGDPLAERILQGIVDSHSAHVYIGGTSLKVLPMMKSPCEPAAVVRPPLMTRTSGNAHHHEDNEYSSRVTSAETIRSEGTGTIARISGSRTIVSNTEMFWSVLSHHAWSIISELFELQCQSDEDPIKIAVQHQSFPLLTRDGQPLGFPLTLTTSGTNGTSSLSSTDKWNVLENELVENWTVFGSETRNQTIQAECSRFFGRVRWTATFTEELLRASEVRTAPHLRTAIHRSRGNLSDEEIRASSRRAAYRIKSALKRQMSGLQDTACLQELLQTAVEVDTHGTSRDFMGYTAAKLVSAGLALVYDSEGGSVLSVMPGVNVSSESTNPYQMRARLAEPLILEAALEYIRETEAILVSRLPFRAASSLNIGVVSDVTGRSAVEVAITTALKPPLHFPFDEIALHRRAIFLEIMRSAKLPSNDEGSLGQRRSQSSGALQNTNINDVLGNTLERYHLYDSGIDTDQGWSSSQRQWTAEDWLLAHHTTSTSRDNTFYQCLPNFFFVADETHDLPGNNASPSLGSCMFFLTDFEDMRRKILCVVQFPSYQSADALRRASADSSAISPMTTRLPEFNWATGNPVAPTEEEARTQRVRERIQTLLSKRRWQWPVIHISVTASPDNSLESNDIDDGLLSPHSAVNKTLPVIPPLSIPPLSGSHYRNRSGNMSSGVNGGSDRVIGERMWYGVEVEAREFAGVVGWTLMEVVTRT